MKEAKNHLLKRKDERQRSRNKEREREDKIQEGSVTKGGMFQNGKRMEKQ